MTLVVLDLEVQRLIVVLFDDARAKSVPGIVVVHRCDELRVSRLMVSLDMQDLAPVQLEVNGDTWAHGLACFQNWNESARVLAAYSLWRERLRAKDPRNLELVEMKAALTYVEVIERLSDRPRRCPLAGKKWTIVIRYFNRTLRDQWQVYLYVHFLPGFIGMWIVDMRVKREPMFETLKKHILMYPRM
ncbi:MAG: hypothetical protein Q9159_001941 [Coniocarpon cinnabarinum]